MKKCLSIALVCWAVGMAHGQTLENLLTMGAENNAGVKSAYASFEEAMIRVSSADALMDPSLNFAVFVQPVETRVGPQRARIDLSQQFPWFGTRKLQEQSASLIAEIQYQAFLDSRNKLYLEIEKNWYALIEAIAELEILRENLNLLELVRQFSTATVQSGEGTIQDVIRVDLEINRLKQEALDLSEYIDALKLKLALTVNQPLPATLQIPSSFPESLLSADSIPASVFNGHPGVISHDLAVELAKTREQLANKGKHPSLKLGLSYVVTEERKDMDVPGNGKDAWAPMVGISLPFFSKKYNVAAKAANLEKIAVEQGKTELVNDLNTDFVLEKFKFEKALRQIGYLREQEHNTRMLLDLERSEYESGKSDIESLLDIERQLLLFQKSTIEAKKQACIAWSSLLYLTSGNNE